MVGGKSECNAVIKNTIAGVMSYLSSDLSGKIRCNPRHPSHEKWSYHSTDSRTPANLPQICSMPAGSPDRVAGILDEICREGFWAGKYSLYGQFYLQRSGKTMWKRMQPAIRLPVDQWYHCILTQYGAKTAKTSYRTYCLLRAFIEPHMPQPWAELWGVRRFPSHKHHAFMVGYRGGGLWPRIQDIFGCFLAGHCSRTLLIISLTALNVASEIFSEKEIRMAGCIPKVWKVSYPHDQKLSE